jgi:hypothetical protein
MRSMITGRIFPSARRSNSPDLAEFVDLARSTWSLVDFRRRR